MNHDKIKLGRCRVDGNSRFVVSCVLTVRHTTKNSDFTMLPYAFSCGIRQIHPLSCAFFMLSVFWPTLGKRTFCCVPEKLCTSNIRYMRNTAFSVGTCELTNMDEDLQPTSPPGKLQHPHLHYEPTWRTVFRDMRHAMGLSELS